MAPVVVVIRTSCSGIVSSAAVCKAPGAECVIVVDLVRGSNVIVVGRCPPKENVVRCNNI